MNRHLIEDQRHHSTATDADLEARMRRWVSGDQYAVALIERDGLPVAYAVWRDDEDGIYVRQFFVSRDHRREGLGRVGFAALVDGWGDKPVKLDALVHNERGLAFWRALGFRDYSLILSLDRPRSGNGRQVHGRDRDQPRAEDGDRAGSQDRRDPAR
ncbi:Acetyltransferase (GNAT) family protein [Asanoa hainanensis]|uniref:Acetyltransferase (GNAT) family protein n=2 Tax=Asanoa hainanensis TaxID=560556 RepID=A0A239M7H8_9ACTN|nr:Acetyltransferase (GNAT) family protein [Asanoa hainanensis]